MSDTTKKPLEWDVTGEKLYETGVSKAVLYPQSSGAYPMGYAWNGLISVNESPSGAEATPLYADNRKYLNLISAEDFAATIEAYMYPDAFKQCNGEEELATGIYLAQQSRTPFGLCYRTEIGSDEDGTEHGYKLHLIYGATAAPAAKQYSTTNESPEAMTLSWEIKTVPVEVTGKKPTAIITIDSTKCPAANLTAIEDALYGTTEADPYLPLPDKIIELLTPQGDEEDEELGTP